MQKEEIKTRREEKLLLSPLIGVLGFHGSVEEHAAVLEKCGANVVLVKSMKDLGKVRGLIIPGGESTHLSKLLKANGLFDALKKRIREGMPVFGTCAGAILLAKKINGARGAKSLGAIDIEISRNAYGRQIDSFETDIKIPATGDRIDGVSRRYNGAKNFHAVFIRAPKIKKIGRGVEILAKYGDEIVMCRRKNILISTFHPELTSDVRIHKYFIQQVRA